ncbi:tol-pal system protein YbgF [Marichromatium sp. AB31]|uniref:tol-pal system protein YbgF n=1 Tax=Marichromatium sp. AB31 TaxID=2483362 RepID=UPI000F3DEC8A|nr:tol-pal system protein YbgF [Marichromatium sp. AB31]MBO8087219.1 tol-pal system protein YbgF [Marichromatium sp.]RNE89841.1 tol-pal system protein YbgF [Marichromatium sp. AB31]
MRVPQRVRGGLGVVVTLVLSAAAAPVLAVDARLEDRVARLERVIEHQRGSDIELQLQQLQSEMQALRGQVEVQQFEIQRLERQLRQQSIDIDARLNGARARPETPEPPAALEAPVDINQPEPAPVRPATPAGGPGAGVPSLPSPETAAGDERDAYGKAFDLLKARKYDQARAAFESLLGRYPQGRYADNARYWLGETFYGQRDYDAALTAFEDLVRRHPASPKVPGALLKMGYIHFEQRDFEQSRARLEQVIDNYPNSTESRLARARLARLDEVEGAGGR